MGTWNICAIPSQPILIDINPKRFNGIYGAAIAAKQSGNPKKVKDYFNQLIELTKDSNSNRPEILEANEYLKNNAI